MLLPVDVAAFRKDAEAGSEEIKTANKYFGEFAPSKLLLAGPAGYDATFWITPKDAGLKFAPIRSPWKWRSPAPPFVYDLEGPDHEQAFTKELSPKFPGIKRILREGHAAHAFERFPGRALCGIDRSATTAVPPSAF